MKRSPSAPAAGFTLLEIMLVVSIIILLLGTAIYKMGGQVNVAKVARAQADIQSIAIPLTSYESLGGSLPSTGQGLKALVEKPGGDPRPQRWVQQMSSLSKDPWNNDYYYEQPGKHNPTTYDLYSAGPDKKSGTDDDIGNWQQ